MSNSSETAINKPEVAKSQLPSINNKSQITQPKTGNIVNTELRKVAQDVLDAARLSLTSVVAKTDMPLAGGSIEAALVKVVERLTPQQRTDAQVRAQSFLNADRKSKEAVYGRFVDIKIDQTKGVTVDQLLQSAKPLVLDPTNLGLKKIATGGSSTAAKVFQKESMVDLARFTELWGGVPRIASTSFAPITGSAQLILTSLRCINETGNSVEERFGDDEMAIAGVSISDAGISTPIAEIAAGSGYHAGVEKTLNDYKFASFNLSETNRWPKHLSVTLIIAEKDWVGLTGFMQKAWEKYSQNLYKKLEEAAKQAGIEIGKLLESPEFGAQLGQFLAEATKWILDNVIKWMISLFKDDIFSPAIVAIELQDINSRWNGSTTSPQISEIFSGHQGQYQLNYKWQLIGMPVVYPDPAKQYSIRAKHSGMCVNVPGGTIESGPLIQYPYSNGQWNESWRFESVGDGFYKIIVKHSGKCFDVQGAYQWDGAQIHQHDYWGGDNQKFRLEHVSDGFFKIVAKHSNKCVNVEGASLNSMANIIQWPYAGGQGNELWQFVEL